MDDSTNDLAILEGTVFLVGLGLLGVAAVLGVIAFTLYKSGARKQANAIVTALSLLSVLAILGYTIAGETRAELIPIASLAVGALAAAMGQLAGKKGDGDPPEPIATPPVRAAKPVDSAKSVDSAKPVDSASPVDDEE